MFTLAEEKVHARITPLGEGDRRAICARMARRLSGSFSTRKAPAPLLWGSPAELDALSLFELDSSIEAIVSVPHVLHIIVDGARRKHIPSFEVRVSGQTVVADILPDYVANDPGRGSHNELLSTAYRNLGIHYQSVAHIKLRREPRLRNARLVLNARRYECPHNVELSLLGILSDQQPHTLEELSQRLTTKADTRSATFALATRGKVSVDLWAPEIKKMVVRLASLRGDK